jgi:hypothetical protein
MVTWSWLVGILPVPIMQFVGVEGKQRAWVTAGRSRSGQALRVGMSVCCALPS